MIRVMPGWIGGAGRQPARRRAGAAPRRDRADRRARSRDRSAGATRGPPPLDRPRRSAAVKEPSARVAPVGRDGTSRRVGEAPGHRARPPDEDLGADRWVAVRPIRPRRPRPGRAPAVDGLHRAHAVVWRYEPGSYAATNASQASVGAASVTSRGARRSAEQVGHDRDDSGQFGDPQRDARAEVREAAGRRRSDQLHHQADDLPGSGPIAAGRRARTANETTAGEDGPDSPSRNARPMPRRSKARVTPSQNLDQDRPLRPRPRRRLPSARPGRPSGRRCGRRA